jgi:hypothetical protein
VINTLTIVGIILIAGIYGGIVNYLTIYNQKETGSNRKCWGAILAGIAASFLVPLFLSMISSDLIVNCRNDDKNYFVFAGLCLVAGIFSGRFINSIGKKILDQVEKTKERINEVEGKNKEQQVVVEIMDLLLENSLNKLFNQTNGGENDNRNIQ